MQLTKKYSYKLPVENIGGLEEFLSDDSLLEISALELLHAVVTCSFPASRLLTGYTRKRREELYRKCAIVESALSENQEYFSKSPSIAYLDSVEKSAISYYLGMIFTKVVCSRIFGVDYLTSIQLIKDEEGKYFHFVDRKKRSEMIGCQHGHEGYSVWASKGRSNNSLDALREGMEQVSEIRSIQGAAPVMRAVCMTYYEKGLLSARVQVPQKPGETDLSFREKEYLSAYYQPVRELFLEFYNREEMRDLRISGTDCVEARITLPYFLREHSPEEVERSFYLGMPKELAEQGLTAFDEIPEEWKDLREGLVSRYGQDCFLGQDFIYVRM